MMRKYLTLIVALILIMPLTSLGLPIQPNYTSPQVISTIPYFQHLQYIISLYNQTKVSNTTKFVMIGNYTATYNVISENNGNITVNLNLTPIQAPKNFSFGLVKPGNYTVNLEEDMLSLSYPYIYSGYLFASAYELTLSFPRFSMYISYQNQTKVNINGNNYTAYEYLNYSLFSFLQQHFYVLNNGIGYLFNTTYTHQTGNKTEFLIASFHLISIENQQNSTLEGAPRSFILDAQKPYQYILYEYSSLSESLQPVTYIQVYYPIVFANGYKAAEQIELSFYSGSPVNQAYSFNLYIGNSTSLPLTFILTNSSQILWGGQIFNKTGLTKINIYGINYSAIVYQNISLQKQITILYFDNNGTLLKIAQGNINGNLENITTILLYTNNLIPPNETYINYFQYATTGTLPYKVISPSYSLLITIIITLVIVAIIVLLYKR